MTNDNTSQPLASAQPQVEQRNARIEKHRSAVPAQAAEFHFAAACFEKILTEAPNNDEEINSRAVEMQHGVFVHLTKMIAIAGHSADISTAGTMAIVTGRLERGDADKLKLEIERSIAPAIKTVQLNSVGELVDEGLAMGTLVEFYHLNTTIPEWGICTSACFLPFAAGTHKLAGEGARIGVHSATLTKGAGPDDGNGTMFMARYVANEGVPAALVGRMVITGDSKMAWLSPDDLRSMGVTIVPNGTKVGAPAQAAMPAQAPSAIQLIGADPAQASAIVPRHDVVATRAMEKPIAIAVGPSRIGDCAKTTIAEISDRFGGPLKMTSRPARMFHSAIQSIKSHMHMSPR